MNILHFIIDLNKGGAETMLYNLCKYKNSSIIKYTIATLKKDNYYTPMLKDLGIEVIEFDLRHFPISSLIKLKQIMKSYDILCCWMYHCNFIGFILGKIAKIPKIFWCIRHSNTNLKFDRMTTLIINKICSLFSSHVDMILYNGEQARLSHENFGYKKSKSLVVNNGCDTNLYRYHENAREELEKELDISFKGKKIILSVSRFNPIKDIPNFLGAISEVRKKRTDIVALMCGKDINNDNSKLIKLIDNKGLSINKDIFLLDERKDLWNLYSACDIYTLHSASEAFPNTLIEAMACRAVCVVTDVGDVKNIVSKDTEVVPPCLISDLTKAILVTIDKNIKKENEIKDNNRKLICSNYSINNIAKVYEEIFTSP